MADSYGSATVNGQLVPVFKWNAFASGNATGPVYGGGPASPATIPPNASSGSASASTAASAPFNVKSSPILLLLVMLVVGVLGLRFIHWRS